MITAEMRKIRIESLRSSFGIFSIRNWFDYSKVKVTFKWDIQGFGISQVTIVLFPVREILPK
jgi:hypothetical protein